MKLKYAARFFLICIPVCAGLFCAPAARAEAESKYAMSIFVYDAQDRRDYILEETQFSLNAGTDTAVSALKAYCDGHNIPFKGTSKYVEGVAGYEQETVDGVFRGWIYHVNGKHMTGSAGSYKLQDGDRLEWYYAVTNEQAFPPASSAAPSAPSVSASSAAPSSAAPSAAASPRAGSSRASSKSVSAAPAQASPAGVSSAAAQWTPAAAESAGSDETADPEQFADVILESGAYLKSNPAAWSAFALYSGGLRVPSAIKKSVRDEIAALSARAPVTDYQRLYFNAAAAGIDNRDLAAPALALDKIKGSGLNAAVFALHVRNVEPGKYKGAATKDELVSLILGAQHADGSFALTKDLPGDIDMTAMAVCALTASDGGAKTDEAAGRAMAWLKAQNAENCESLAQTLLAASLRADRALEVEAAAQLLLYRRADGGFSHLQNGESDPIATEQALLGFAAMNGKTNPFLLEKKPAGGAALFFIAGGALILAGAAVFLAILLIKRKGRGSVETI